MPNDTPNPTPLPADDTERLDSLLEYLDDIQGALLHISGVLNAKPAQQEKKRTTFVKRFGVAPEIALQHALDGLTRQTLAVKAQRALEELESDELTSSESDI
jgi:hypothetical protein